MTNTVGLNPTTGKVYTREEANEFVLAELIKEEAALMEARAEVAHMIVLAQSHCNGRHEGKPILLCPLCE